MGETINLRTPRFEIDPNATPQAMLETSMKFLATSIEEFSTGIDESRSQSNALNYIPNFISTSLWLGMDPQACLQRFRDLLARNNTFNPEDQKLALARAHIYAGELDQAKAMLELNDLTKTKSRQMLSAYAKRLAYEGKHDKARQAIIREEIEPASTIISGNLGSLLTWENMLDQETEARYTLALAWQTIEMPSYNRARRRAAQPIPHALLPEYGLNDPQRPHYKAKHKRILEDYCHLARCSDGKSREVTLHRATRYILHLYAEGGALNDGSSVHAYIKDCTESGPLKDVILVRGLMEANANSILADAHDAITTKILNLTLAQRFVQDGDFDQAHTLAALYPEDLDATSVEASLLAKRGDIAQAIAITRTPKTLDPSQVYALKHVVLRTAEAIAEDNIECALMMLDSIDIGWGNTWIRLKPTLEPSIRRAQLFVKAREYARALTMLNGLPITDLTDALFVLQTLEKITEAAAADHEDLCDVSKKQQAF